MPAGPDVADHQRDRAAVLASLVKAQADEIQTLRREGGSAPELFMLAGGLLLAIAIAMFWRSLTPGEMLVIALMYGAGLIVYGKHLKKSAVDAFVRQQSLQERAEKAGVTLPPS